MGKRILALAVQDKLFDVVAAVDYEQHPDIGKDAGVLAGTDPIDVKLSADFPVDADVMIDFSLPEATDKVVEHCIDNERILFDFADIEAYDPDGNYFWDQTMYDNLAYSGGN